ncbi:hypothetical protein [Lewinella sp. W8]|uniref:hypothetical protein n=1 Tax=Lewinella sp. W8 TaxID=2528208 RepID=UPI001067FF4C|nr:hypothetical protein [Lewinella sp. W8]MTB51000.1 hypothetical protein [Lewinella sp. W8]
MRFPLLVLLLCTGLFAKAQFGVSSFYNLNQTVWSGPADQLTDAELLDNGIEFAAHYWFRLPQKRVEFQPTLYYAAANTALADGRYGEYGFQFKTNIYLFDFGTDCDCPTFGKQGPQLQKGFFVQLSPGYAFYRWDNGLNVENTSAFTFGGGVGIDFGISNLLTLTPLVSARYGTGPFVDFRFTDVNGEPVDGSPKSLAYQLGLQATFRLDKRRY